MFSTDPTAPRTVEEWAIRRQRALDQLDLYISVVTGYLRLHGASEEAIAEALNSGEVRHA